MHGVNLAALVCPTTRRFQPADPVFGLFAIGIDEGEFLEIRPGGFRPSCEGISLKKNRGSSRLERFLFDRLRVKL